MRLAYDEGVESYGHDAGGQGFVAHEGGQVVVDALEHGGAGVAEPDVDADVVQFVGVGDGEQAAAGDLQVVGLVVVDPIEDEFDAFVDEEFRRVGGLSERRARANLWGARLRRSR